MFKVGIGTSGSKYFAALDSRRRSASPAIIEKLPCHVNEAATTHRVPSQKSAEALLRTRQGPTAHQPAQVAPYLQGNGSVARSGRTLASLWSWACPGTRLDAGNKAGRTGSQPPRRRKQGADAGSAPGHPLVRLSPARGRGGESPSSGREALGRTSIERHAPVFPYLDRGVRPTYG